MKNKTTMIVRDAMKTVSKDVRAPKVVRDGVVKPKVEIEIPLLPEDFKHSDYVMPNNCALSKAASRYFELPATCNNSHVTIWRGSSPYLGGLKKKYRIKDFFDSDDYAFVEKEYKKDPKMKKAQYFVTLIQS